MDGERRRVGGGRTAGRSPGGPRPVRQRLRDRPWASPGWWTRQHEVATPRAVGASLGVLYLAAALALAAQALGVPGGFPFVSEVDSSDMARSLQGPVTLLALSAAAVVVGAVVTVRREAVTHRWAHLLTAVATCLIGVAVVAAPDDGAAVALAAVYGFVVIESAVVFAPGPATLQFLLCGSAAVISLSCRDDVDPGEMVAVVVVLLATAAVVGVLARHASDARVDELTGLPNRRGLDQMLEAAATAAGRGGTVLTVGLLDLDGFGAVNDGLGHEAGDRLLRETATAWREALPADVVLARMGGDEFAVLLPDRSPAAAAALLDGLCADPHRPASAGVAAKGRTESTADVVRRADAALYRAKSTGRGRCLQADHDLPGSGDSAALTRELTEALRHGGLHLVYQPLRATPSTPGFAAEEALLVGVETLVRWTHPVHGPVGPDVFVPLAEREGLVAQLGAFVLRRACQEMAALPDAAARRVRLSVNVSGLELLDPAYPGRVADALRDSGWPADLLVLEVTESVVEADSRAALATLRAVADLGVALAVDDFGTGFSALSRLDDIGAGYLKLDSTLIATVHTSPRRARLVRAAAALARSLDITLVAEGVETLEQAHVLAAMGCPVLQGFHLGRPEPVEALARRLAAETTHPAGRALPLQVPAAVVRQGRGDHDRATASAADAGRPTADA